MGSSFFCLICQNTMNEGLAYQMPTCPCVLCTHCAHGGIVGQLHPLIQALVNSEDGGALDAGALVHSEDGGAIECTSAPGLVESSKRVPGTGNKKNPGRLFKEPCRAPGLLNVNAVESPPGLPDAISGVCGSSTADRDSSVAITLECPACGKSFPVASVHELIHESLEIWRAISPEVVPCPFPSMEGTSTGSRGEAGSCTNQLEDYNKPSSAEEERFQGLVACQMCKEKLCGDVLFRTPICGCTSCLPCVQPLLHSQLEEKIMRCSAQGDEECLDCPTCGAAVPVALLEDILPDSVQRWEEDRQWDAALDRGQAVGRVDQTAAGPQMSVMRRWDDEQFLELMTLRQCPSCGAVVFRVPDSASVETDDRGRPLSGAAMRHKLSNSCRCQDCDASYCGCCDTVPYHLGRTCAEHELFSRSPSCRFCGEKIRNGGNKGPADVRKGKGPAKSGGNKDLAEFGKGILSPNGPAMKVRGGCSTLRIGQNFPRGPVEDCEEQSMMARVCNEGDCQEKAKQSCTRTHPACGHSCGGVRGEQQCLPCMQEDCRATNQGIASVGDLCPICLAEPLGSAPAIRLQCRHVIHASCAMEMVKRGCPGPELSFRFLECPVCQQVMEHPHLRAAMQPSLVLKAKVETLIENKVRGLGKKFRTKLEESNERSAVERRCLFFRCDKCQEPFHGGDRNCGNAGIHPYGGGAEGDKEVTVCERCGFSTWSGETSCKGGHRDQYIQYKCRYCCAPASWFCFGTTHFCNECHHRRADLGGVYRNPACRGGPGCPLQVAVHPPAGQEFILGCGLCRTSNKKR